MTKNPQPNGLPVTEVDYKHLPDGTILKQTITKEIFKGLPMEAIKKEEQQRNIKDIAKKTVQNQNKKQAQDATPNKTIIKTLIAKIRKKAPHHTSSIQVMIAALLGYNLALNELDNFNSKNLLKHKKRG